MRATKTNSKKVRRPHVHVRNYDAVFWTTPMCRKYSGLSHAQVLKGIADGDIEAVAIGPEQTRTLPNGTVCHRECAKYLVTAESFKRFVAGLAARGRFTVAGAQ